MKIVYANQPIPEEWVSAIFLAGPTPRSGHPVPSWRPDALRLLEEAGYEGVVFVPEAEDGQWLHSYDAQVEWERKGLTYADVILFWVPRDLVALPAYTTNVEFGRWVTSGKVVLGAPPDAPKLRYLDWLLDHETQGHEGRASTLTDTVQAALERIGQPSVLREGGERCVPLHVWDTQGFQQWYSALKAAGNRLDEAEVRWVFRVPKLQKVFSWVLWVKVWIAAEERYKKNEWVFSRTDISAVVLYESFVPNDKSTLRGDALWDTLLSTEVVLVREFRSPVRNSDGYVYELPGGSTLKEGKDPREVAASEVHEETGLIVESRRFRRVGSRQLAATLSSHHAHVYMAELTGAEMRQAKELARKGVVHGVEGDSERTYVEVLTLRDMLQQDLVDWSTAGMVFQALVG